MTAMVRRAARPVVDSTRYLLDRCAAQPVAARAMRRVVAELDGALQRGRWLSDRRTEMYEASYFGVGRDPGGDRAGRSGYARYDRISSNAEIAGFLVWRTFGGARTVLDVGCATGLVVEVLRELGMDAEGCDVSRYAVDHPSPGAAGHLRVGDLLGRLPYEDGAFDVVVALETLEHLPPEDVDRALRELRRVCRGVLYATIPSFGPNGGGGPDGHVVGKVRPERIEHYQALGASFDGPVPFDDLARDVQGDPVEGHLTIASFAWWTARFAAAGFERRPDVERRMVADLVPDLAAAWNLYATVVPGVDEAVLADRDPGRSLVALGLRHPLYEAAAVAGTGDRGPAPAT